jgi:hypothetical protein
MDRQGTQTSVLPHCRLLYSVPTNRPGPELRQTSWSRDPQGQTLLRSRSLGAQVKGVKPGSLRKCTAKRNLLSAFVSQRYLGPLGRSAKCTCQSPAAGNQIEPLQINNGHLFMPIERIQFLKQRDIVVACLYRPAVFPAEILKPDGSVLRRKKGPAEQLQASGSMYLTVDSPKVSEGWSQ